MKYIVLLVLILAVYAKKVLPPFCFKYFSRNKALNLMQQESMTE